MRRHETPFVGREGLLDLFDEALERARQTRRLVVRLVGEAGIGKTRLLREFARRGTLLGCDVSWIDDASPGLDLRSDPGELSVIASPSGRDPGTLPRLIVVDLTGRPARLHDVADLVADDASTRPLIVFLAISSVGASFSPVRRVLAQLARQRLLHEIDVPPLADAEILEVAGHILGGTPHARLHRTIDALSEGNPSLVEEVAWDLQRVGLVRQQRGTSYLLGEVSDTYVPSGIAAALTVELDAIEPEVVGTLSAAAVLGSAIDFDVLASALPLPDEQLLRHLEAGLAHGILRQAPDPSPDFLFTHELVRRMLYRRLSQTRRRSLHQVVAEALERMAVQGPTDHSPALAQHFTLGCDPARALEYVLRAQKGAERDSRWDDAIRYCRQALDLTRQSSTTDLVLQIELLERLGALYFGQAETFAAGACWREALQLCDQTGSVMRSAALAARLAALGASWGSVQDAESGLEAALKSGSAGDVEHAADAAAWCSDAHYELGLAHQRRGRLPQAIHHLQTACDAPAPEDQPRRVLAQASLARALVTAGRSTDALELLTPALDQFDADPTVQNGHDLKGDHLRDPRRVRCVALGELARALCYLGRYDEAADAATTVMEQERRFGILGGRGQRVMAQVELARGRPDRAIEVLAERMRESAAGSLSAHRVVDLLLLAEAHLASGVVDLALEVANDGIHLCRRTRAREHLAGLQSILARAQLARGDVDAAFTTIAAARQTIAETGAEAYRSALVAAEGAYLAATARSPSGPASRSAHGTAGQPPGGQLLPGTGVGSHGPRVRDSASALTGREREVLSLMAEGRSNRQIADVLILSEKTVKRHLSNTFAKLGVGTRAAAVRRGFETGIL
jgi:DNA-binding NarL/FixJ family response regulator/tetratricopeptide (TPR) repeat protein